MRERFFLDRGFIGFRGHHEGALLPRQRLIGFRGHHEGALLPRQRFRV